MRRVHFDGHSVLHRPGNSPWCAAMPRSRTDCSGNQIPGPYLASRDPIRLVDFDLEVDVLGGQRSREDLPSKQRLCHEAKHDVPALTIEIIGPFALRPVLLPLDNGEAVEKDEE